MAERLFRAMRVASDGMPRVGDSSTGLGVRVGRGKDIEEVDGLVHPGTGGMSTTANDPYLLPKFARPLCLDGECDGYTVFSIESDQLPQLSLQSRQDQPEEEPSHRTVEPAGSCTLATYRANLISTRPLWIFRYD
jgi:hypothetical protein